VDDTFPLRTLSTLCNSAHERSIGKGKIMSATQFGLGLLYIAVAVLCYAAGWWQGKTVERERWEERVVSLSAAPDAYVEPEPDDPPQHLRAA
jgi:hypothetical protein